jgi:hypothetical protein
VKAVPVEVAEKTIQLENASLDMGTGIQERF